MKISTVWHSRLQPFAQDLSVRYGAQVVLLGGALHQEWPRDVDVRALILDDERFERRFGLSVADWQQDRGTRWLREVSKMTRRLEMILPHGCGADFSIWPICVFDDRAEHIILAEGRLDPILDATREQLLEEVLRRAARFKGSRIPAQLETHYAAEAAFLDAIAAELQKVPK